MKSLTRHLYFWVLVAIIAGGTLGYVNPAAGVSLKPLGDGFIALVKMLIAPVIFCTVVLGIAGAGDMKKVGRVGGKALLYFEVVSTFALIIGLVVANLLEPGAGFNADPATLDARAVADYAKVAATQTTVDFVMHIIPRTFFDAFTGSGDLLQVLFVAVLFGYAMTHLGREGSLVHQVIETASHVFFRMMNALMKLAPLGAGGAMAFTIGRYGIDALKPLALEQGGLQAAFAALLANVTAGTGLTAHFACSGEPCPLPLDVEESLLRIGQEALTNVLKHAEARRFEAVLTFDEAAIALALRDDGVGFDPAVRTDGMGLRGMHERAERLGGQIEVDSALGHGTRILVRLPRPA